MAEQLTPDLCVIGAGAAGLAIAAAAAALGVPVVLVEKGRFGGEHVNTGCVPSKAMIAAAKRAEAMRTAAPFGIKSAKPTVEFDEVNDHIHRVINAIAPNDSKERFAGLGVRVDRRRGALLRQQNRRRRPGVGRQVRDQGTPLRDRDRFAAARADDLRNRADALSHQRERLRDRASGRST